MQLHLDDIGGRYTITAYGEDGIVVNEERLSASFIIGAEDLVRDWPPSRPEDIAPADVERIISMRPELVLFGTGTSLRFLPPATTAPLHAAGIGFECMDTAAACRSFRILQAEGRRVVAAMLMFGAR